MTGPETGREATEAATASELARLLSYLVVLGVAVWFYLAAGALPSSRWEPLGAGAFPRLVMALLAGLSLLGVALSLRRLAHDGVMRISVGYLVRWVAAHRLVVYVFVAFAAYLAVLKLLGFSLATFLFLLAAQLIVAPRSRRTFITALVIAVVFSYGLNWIFAELFTVFLPRGPAG